MDNFITGLNYDKSRRNMGAELNRLYVKRKRTPEGDERDKIDRKIELLKIIRSELKGLINALD